MSNPIAETENNTASMSEQWVSRGQLAVMNTYGRFPLTLVSGDGMTVTDAEGKTYLDFVAGIAVNALGHNHSKLVSAVSQQATQLMHCSNLYWIPAQIELAEILVANSGFHKVFFCNSGAEGNEAALKLARKYSQVKFNNPDRVEVIAMKNSFHGRTYGALSLTGQEKYHQGFSPLLAGIRHVPFNDSAALKAAINPNTCAILLEIIQGEGGVCPIDEQYYWQVKQWCEEHQLLLMVDEVQTGIGRTGQLFAHQTVSPDIQPDIMVLAKGLGGGFPIGAMLATDSVAESFKPGDHASTFGGNPLACVAGLTVLNELLDNNQAMMSHVREMGVYLNNALMALKLANPIVQQVRGLGLMQGIVLSGPSAPVVKACMEKGLLLVGAGTNVIRFVPPLIVEKSHIDQMIAILSDGLQKLYCHSRKGGNPPAESSGGNGSPSSRG